MTVRRTPPFAFFFLNASLGWPVGVIGLALTNVLVRSGFTVGQAASIWAAGALPFTLQFLLGPIVDSSATRRGWFVGGTLFMGVCLAALLVAPWKTTPVAALATLAFCSCLGAALCAAATKGMIAYHVPPERLGAASGWYISGGGLSHAIAGGGTLWLLTHIPSRPVVALISVGAALLSGGAIVLVSREEPARLHELPEKLLGALRETWALIRTQTGLLVLVLCVIPFGSGGTAPLFGALAPAWSVGPDLVALLGTLGAVMGVGGPLLAGWLSVRVGAWKTYIFLGWILVAAAIALAVSPRVPADFAVLELLYRGAARTAAASLLAIVMAAAGKGAASTKASTLWSVGNLTTVYPPLILGAVHTRTGSVSATLLADAGLAAAGYVVLLAVARLLKVRLRGGVAELGVAA